MTVTTKAPLVVIPRTDVKAAGKTAAAQTSIAYKTCSFVCSSLAPVADTAAAALKTALVTTVNVAIENSSLSQAMKTSLKTSVFKLFLTFLQHIQSLPAPLNPTIPI